MLKANIITLIDKRIKQELEDLKVEKSNDIRILHEVVAREGQHGIACINKVKCFCSQEIKDATDLISKIIKEFIRSSGAKYSEDLASE